MNLGRHCTHGYGLGILVQSKHKQVYAILSNQSDVLRVQLGFKGGLNVLEILLQLRVFYDLPRLVLLDVVVHVLLTQLVGCRSLPIIAFYL